MNDRRFLSGLAGLALVLAGSAGLAFGLSSPTSSAAPVASGPEFVVECTWSHRAADDPIVHPGHAGASHLHDFFGSASTNASSTGSSLLGSDTTCQTHPGDTAAYWAPTLYVADAPIDPGRLFAYYRRAPDSSIDPASIRPYPLGLAMVAGDASATVAQSTALVSWRCGAASAGSASPPVCPASAPLTLRVVFPSCWDGVHLDSSDHRSHVAYPDASGCPSAHPIALPELVVDVAYQFSGDPSELRLASGGIVTAHADFLNGWNPGDLARLVESCLYREAECGIRPSRSSI